MSSRYAIHPLEQKFRTDIEANAKRDAYIKDLIQECEELGIDDPIAMFKRAFIMGQYYECQLRVEQTGERVEPTRTYEQWLDKTTKDGEYRYRDYISPSTHPTGRMVYETLMKELAK